MIPQIAIEQLVRVADELREIRKLLEYAVGIPRPDGVLPSISFVDDEPDDKQK